MASDSLCTIFLFSPYRCSYRVPKAPSLSRIPTWTGAIEEQHCGWSKKYLSVRPYFHFPNFWKKTIILFITILNIFFFFAYKGWDVCDVTGTWNSLFNYLQLILIIIYYNIRILLCKFVDFSLSSLPEISNTIIYTYEKWLKRSFNGGHPTSFLICWP